MHPHTADGFGHDTAGVFDSGVLGMLGGLFCFADIFAIGGIVGHPLTQSRNIQNGPRTSMYMQPQSVGILAKLSLRPNQPT